MLEQINEPKDLKKLNKEELLTLAGEIREIIINLKDKKSWHTPIDKGEKWGII